MSDSAYRVDTAPRLAQWRIDALSSCTYRKSDPFRIGLWNWYLIIERSKQLCVKLCPEAASVSREQPPIASFIIKLVSSTSPSRKTLVHPGVCDKQLKNSDDFVWAVDTLFAGRFVIDVEFLDLKIVPTPGTGQRGAEACTIKGYRIEHKQGLQDQTRTEAAVQINCRNKLINCADKLQKQADKPQRNWSQTSAWLELESSPREGMCFYLCARQASTHQPFN